MTPQYDEMIAQIARIRAAYDEMPRSDDTPVRFIDGDLAVVIEGGQLPCVEVTTDDGVYRAQLMEIDALRFSVPGLHAQSSNGISFDLDDVVTLQDRKVSETMRTDYERFIQAIQVCVPMLGVAADMMKKESEE